MSAATNGAMGPLFALPRFHPDTVGFALRTTMAQLLACYASFAVQPGSDASAGQAW